MRKDELVKIIIISHKRWKNVRSRKILPSGSYVICVPKHQAAEYARYNKGVDLLVHPDFVGLSPKLRWIEERFDNYVILDDDIDFVNRNYHSKESGFANKLNKFEVYDLIQATANTTRNLGAKLFGFATSPTPINYLALKPFKRSGFVIGGCMGIIDGFKAKIPDNAISCHDYWYSGMNAHLYKHCFCDTRFFFGSEEKTFESQGGMADMRSVHSEKEDLILLRESFGDIIKPKKGTQTRKSLQHPYEKIMQCPF